MAIKAVRIKLKPDSLDKVQQWANEINARKDEALLSLANESVTIEAAFLDQIKEEYYLIYLMKGDLERSKAVASISENPIDTFHKQFKKCWESIEEMEPLVWLEQEPDPILTLLDVEE